MREETQQNDAFDYPELDKMGATAFYCTYRNFMRAIAHREGMDCCQADMVIDDVMITIYMKQACHYDPKKSRFGNYLATMVRNTCRSLRRREHRYVNVEEEELVIICEDNGAVTKDMKYAPEEISGWIREGLQVLRQEMRSQLMMEAFTRTVIENERPLDVARKLNVQPDYIYLAKNRCLPRLRTIIGEIMGKDK